MDNSIHPEMSAAFAVFAKLGLFGAVEMADELAQIKVPIASILALVAIEKAELLGDLQAGRLTAVGTMTSQGWDEVGVLAPELFRWMQTTERQICSQWVVEQFPRSQN